MDTNTGRLVDHDPQSDFQVKIPDHLIGQAREVAAQGLSLWDSNHSFPQLRAWALANMNAVPESAISLNDLIVRNLPSKKEKARRKKLKRISEKSRKRNR